MIDAEAYSWEWWATFAGGVSTLAVFSFLYRENRFYRIFEHFYIGIATAYGVMSLIRDPFWPEVIRPLFGFERVVFPDGSVKKAYDQRELLLILPIVFGSLYYTILSRRWSWIAQVVIGFSFGVSAGLTFKGLFVELLPQIFDSFRPVYVPGSWGETVSNLVFIVILLSSMTYFFFSFKRRPGGLVERTSSLGRWMLMGCFGAFFGSTIMARMALLVERLDFLVNEWWPALEKALHLTAKTPGVL